MICGIHNAKGGDDLWQLSAAKISHCFNLCTTFFFFIDFISGALGSLGSWSTMGLEVYTTHLCLCVMLAETNNLIY